MLCFRALTLCWLMKTGLEAFGILLVEMTASNRTEHTTYLLRLSSPSLHAIPCSHSVRVQIARYQPGRNVCTDEFGDNSVHVLGEISKVRNSLTISYSSPFHIPQFRSQMQPLLDDDDKEIMYDDTIDVTVSGTVMSTVKETCTFFMQGIQYVCGRQEEVAIRAHLNNPKWKDPSAVLPRSKAVIGFDGHLDGFETFTPSHSTENMTRIVVAVQDISFLHPPPEQSASAGKSSAKNTGLQSVRDKVKRRRQKKKDTKSTPSTPDISPTPTMASSSQSVLGKRRDSTN